MLGFIGETYNIIIYSEYSEYSFSCVSPGIDQEFPHDIVRVAVDVRGHNQVGLQTTLTML